MHLVLPTVAYLSATSTLAPRPPSLDGRVLGIVDGWAERHPDGSYGMYPILAELQRLLAGRFRLAEVVWVRKAKAAALPSPQQIDLLLGRCAAAVVGVGLSGGSTAGTIRDAAELERRGLPTVAVCAAEYERVAHLYARCLGVPDLPLLVTAAPEHGNVPGHPGDQAARGLDTVVAALVAARG